MEALDLRGQSHRGGRVVIIGQICRLKSGRTVCYEAMPDMKERFCHIDIDIPKLDQLGVM